MTFGSRTANSSQCSYHPPGPGYYNDHTTEGMNKTGTYHNSAHKSSLA